MSQKIPEKNKKSHHSCDTSDKNKKKQLTEYKYMYLFNKNKNNIY